jgi:hypothetical protein
VTNPSRPGVDPSAPPLEPPTPYRTGALLSLLRRHWFIHLRWGFVVVAGGLLAAERLARPRLPRPGALYATVIAIALVNVLWTVVARSRWSRAQDEPADDTRFIRSALVFANAQVAVDLLLLTVIMRYTGGVENPMAVFYLFHMAIGSLVLRSRQAALQAVWAVALFSAMGIAELRGWIQPHYLLLPALPAPGLYAQPDYVAVVIAVFAGGVFGTLFFTLRIASRLDEGEHQLREAHEALQASQLAVFDLQARRPACGGVAVRRPAGSRLLVLALAAPLHEESAHFSRAHPEASCGSSPQLSSSFTVRW